MCEIRTFRRNPSNKEKEMSSSVDGPERLGRTWEEDSMKVFSEHFSEQTLEKENSLDSTESLPRQRYRFSARSSVANTLISTVSTL